MRRSAGETGSKPSGVRRPAGETGSERFDMKYTHIRRGRFLERPNRFIAYVELDGKREKVHVKNTGRCGELLKEGAQVYLEKSENPRRSTLYDLVAVRKGGMLVNVDSAAPNRAAQEWLEAGGLARDIVMVRPECTYGKSRFDFYVKAGDREIWVEVKGVNLEKDRVAFFPDAPSARALKHVEELAQACQRGYEAVLLFVVQMEGIRELRPNRKTQPEFAQALVRAREAGVQLLARGCRVTEDGMEISYEIPVELDEKESAGEGAGEEKPCKIGEKDTAGMLEEIAPGLLSWYDTNRRILPWRENPTPYAVWVSEIMLQQTRVEAVRPYFERFMEEFPDIPSLAAAQDDRLLKLWEGLGYYNRARNLKKAAEEMVRRYESRMPDRPAELLSLPGIGSYTAGAVASIAFGRPVPAVDGNVLRVISRYRADGRDVTNAGVKRSVEEDLARVIPEERPGDFNQALMELGAMVCVPNGAPLCGECPLSSFCLARRLGTQTAYPQKAEKKKRTIEKKTILLILDGRKVAIQKRPERGLLAGMYEFPSAEGHLLREEVLDYLKERGIRAIRIRELPFSKHVFTHKEWHMIGYAVRVDGLEPCCGDWEGLVFVEPECTQERYPIPSAYAAYTEYLGVRLGNSKYEAVSEEQKTDE